MLENLPHPAIIAHRGASLRAPENTLAAFELAVAQGADAIELDTKLSADGHPVVIHDATVDRTTDGRGRVRDLPLAELRRLDAGGFMADGFRGERIPTLEEVFEQFGKRIFINVELTNYNTPRDHLVESVSVLVRKFGLQKQILFSSFLASNLSAARRFLPEVPRGLLALNGLLGAWSRSFGFAFGKYHALHPHLTDVTPQQIQRVHRLKRRVHVWTVNAEADMRRLFDWGADAVFTDDPQLAVRARGDSG